MLTPGQQERYARHLLLDGFDQERLLAAGVRVRGSGAAALWAARYLAASGVGRLEIDEPAWRGELEALGPWLTVVRDAARDARLVEVSPREGATPAESALNGAQAALEATRVIGALK